MPLYKFTAMDKAGKTIGSVKEADSEASLTKLLTADGLFLVDASIVRAPVKPTGPKKAAVSAEKTKAAAAKAATVRPGKAKRVPTKVVSVFTSQFALMVKSSLPALQAITSLTLQQTNPSLIAALLDIQERLKRGEYLSRAFSQHPEAFDSVYTNLLSAGEASGKVAIMLDRIADYLEFQTDLARKIRSAMVYPMLVLGASVGIILFLMMVVLPNFVDIFAQFNAPLPTPTRLLLATSSAMRSYWWLELAAAAAVGAAARWWLIQPENKEFVDTSVLGIPVMGSMIEAIILTRILRILEVLLESGVPILKALELTKAAANQRYFELLLDRVMANVSEGKGVASALYGEVHFPGAVADMIATSERTGGLPGVLRMAAEHYQKELDSKITDTFAALEPVFIGGLSMIVAGIAISILSPIMSLGSMVE